MEKPDKHHLIQIIKVNINTDKPLIMRKNIRQIQIKGHSTAKPDKYSSKLLRSSKRRKSKKLSEPRGA